MALSQGRGHITIIRKSISSINIRETKLSTSSSQNEDKTPRKLLRIKKIFCNKHVIEKTSYKKLNSIFKFKSPKKQIINFMRKIKKTEFKINKLLMRYQGEVRLLTDKNCSKIPNSRSLK